MQPAIEAILRDESLAFAERLRRFRAQADPRNAIEDSSLDEIVHLGSQLEFKHDAEENVPVGLSLLTASLAPPLGAIVSA